MRYTISELLDVPKLQAILDSLYEVSRIPSALIDLEGRILTGSGWQDICTKFHRVHPATERQCIESDRTIALGLQDRQTHVQITCPQGLTDTATPLIIEGEHLANIFTGQLFLSEPDRDFFRQQARILGFDEAAYLEAVDSVPVVPQEKLNENLSFIAQMTELLAMQGLTRLRSLEVQESLRESEERLQQIINSALEGIIVYDKDFRYQLWNRYMEQLSGYSAAEVIGKTPWELFPFLERAEIADRLNRALSGEQVETIEFPFDLPNVGRTGWSDDKCGPLRSAHGDVVGVIGTVRDITEHKKAEELMRQAMKMESVGRLAGGVAHDFNNLLTVIIGQTELALLDLQETDPLRHRLEQVAAAAERSSRITRQLLAFSRKEIIDPKPINVNHLIADTEKTLLRLIEEDINLNLRLAPDVWTIKIDPSQLDQILVNLAVNARDAMPEGGDLFIQTGNVELTEENCHYLHDSRPGEFVVLTISDSGTGMDTEVREHLFEPFYTTKGDKGTGLGLATVYGVVRQNDGFINVYSELGQGTAFKIYFPRLEEAALRIKRETPTAHYGTGTVLLVEDNDMVRTVTRSYLEQLGYSVIPASTPQAGIDICADPSRHIDIVLTDVVMPTMSGKEMIDRIAAVRPGLRALFMSGYTADHVAKRGVVEEGTHFIQKPFDLQTLSQKLHETLST